MSKYQKGADALAEASKFTEFARAQYLGQVISKDQSSCILRWVTDHTDWITVMQHQSVLTRPAPSWHKSERPWAERVQTVCRHTLLDNGQEVWEVLGDGPAECWPCDHMTQQTGKFAGRPYKASPRGWALAVLREEVRENGIIAGYTDVTREVNRDGQNVKEKAFVIANMGERNFFSAMGGLAKHYGTALDRDYKVTRYGVQLDTDYQFVPLDPIPSAKGSQFKYYDVRDPEVAKRYVSPYDLEKEVDRLASWEYQRRWFDPSFTPPDTPRDDDQGAPVSEQAKPSEPELDLAAMRARVESYSVPQGD